MDTTTKNKTNSHASAAPNSDGIEHPTPQVTDEMDGNAETIHDCAPSTPDRKSVSDVVDINALIAESMPDADTDQGQLVAFIKKQYDGYLFVGKQNSVFQKRIGDVLIRLKEVIPHGEWQDVIKETFPFTPRSATNYMRLASTTTVEEARTTALTELYQEKGIIPYRKEKPSTADDEGNGDDEREGDGKSDDDMADLKAVEKKVAKVTTVAHELQDQIANLPPQSYQSNEKHAAFLKGFAAELHGAVLNLYRSVVALTEFVKSANDSALEDVLESLETEQAVLAVLEQPALTITKEVA